MATTVVEPGGDLRGETGETRSRITGRELIVVFVVAAAAAVAYTWPLVTTLGHSAHDTVDAVVQAWAIDWVQHAIRTPAHLFDANIFAPQSDTLAYTDSLIGVAIPLLPLRWLGVSPIGQVNVAVILGTAVTATSAYVFGRIVTRSRAVSAVVAAAFAFGPLATTHIGHVQTIWRAGIPLSSAAAWALADRAERNASLWPPALGMFAALAWQASVAFHPTAYAIVATAVVLLARRRSLGRRGFVTAGAALGASAGVIVLLGLPYLSNASRFHDFDFKLATLSRYGVDFTSTDPRVWLWGSALGKGSGWPAFGGSSFPGVALLLLGLLGVVAGWRARTYRRATAAGAALVAVGAVLAIGASNRGWRQFTPYRALYEWVPGWRALRATDRAWFIGILGLGLLAGIGALSVGRWLARRGWRGAVLGVVVAVVLAIGVEGYAPWTGLPTVRVSAVDVYLASVRRTGGVVYLPANSTGTRALDLTLFLQPLDMYGTTAHHRRTPNGFASYIPRSYATTFARLRSLPSRRALATLRALDVRYVVVHRGVAGGPWDRLLHPARARPLQYVGRFGHDMLYVVPAESVATN